MRRQSRLTIVAAAGLLSLGAGGCGSAAPDASPTAGRAPVTITFWHSWSAPSEIKGIDDNLARFRQAHPEITVKTRAKVTDDDMTKAITGGATEPDVVTSFNTDAVGQFCASGDWIDLSPLLQTSKVSIKRTFPRAVMDYTQYNGVRCAMPLLADAFGLYYNKTLLAAAGISRPPKNLSELRADAVKLTKRDRAGRLTTVGFLPLAGTYEQTASRLVATWQPRYYDAQGHSNLARDPAVRQFLDWQRNLIDAEGGYAGLKAFQDGLGDEFSPQNAFEQGRLAMMFDGEWRTAFIAADKVPFDYGTAPFPVPDNLPETYGGGYLAGTIIGISKNSKNRDAAWELVKYLTTESRPVASFATAIKNVPSTYQALDAATALADDEHFRSFLQIFASPDSGATPTSADGGKARAGFATVVDHWQAGRLRDPHAALTTVDQAIDAATRQ